MENWWEREIIASGKLPLLIALLAFVLTFLLTRTVTRMIRAGRGPFHNVSAGGLHVHHAVPGVLLMVVGGFGAVAAARHGVWAGVAAAVFGAGAGLVLDEFALILYLSDVYWTEEGRKSVEVATCTGAVVLLALIGFTPLGVPGLSGSERDHRGALVALLAFHASCSLLALVKGKPRMALFGVLVPTLSLVAALRLARPGSPWYRRGYRNRPRARARAVRRGYHHDRRWARLDRWFQDLVGGTPSAAAGGGSPNALNGPAHRGTGRDRDDAGD